MVEIKSNLNDFLSNEKWQNYLNFCDYFCFAIHQHESELIEAIEVVTHAGILLVDFHSQLGENMTYSVIVHRKPKKKTGKFKHLVYETLYERLLKWTERK